MRSNQAASDPTKCAPDALLQTASVLLLIQGTSTGPAGRAARGAASSERSAAPHVPRMSLRNPRKLAAGSLDRADRGGPDMWIRRTPGAALYPAFRFGVMMVFDLRSAALWQSQKLARVWLDKRVRIC